MTWTLFGAILSFIRTADVNGISRRTYQIRLREKVLPAFREAGISGATKLAEVTAQEMIAAYTRIIDMRVDDTNGIKIWKHFIKWCCEQGIIGGAEFYIPPANLNFGDYTLHTRSGTHPTAGGSWLWWLSKKGNGSFRVELGYHMRADLERGGSDFADRAWEWGQEGVGRCPLRPGQPRRLRTRVQGPTVTVTPTRPPERPSDEAVLKGLGIDPIYEAKLTAIARFCGVPRADIEELEAEEVEAMFNELRD